ncbi:MAG: muconolactone Delta-isomerase family protein [Bacteroidota bacterium]
MNTEYQYMVDFTLPESLSEEFMSLIPYQRAAINRLFKEGKLVNYALSLENSKLWAVFSANSEMAVMEIIADLPLTEYMNVEISMLTFYNTTNPAMPHFSNN